MASTIAKFKKQGHIVDVLFVLCLFALYTVSILVLCIVAINIYTKGVEMSEQNYNVRTSVLYLTEKTRQNNTTGGIRVDEVAGKDALVLIQYIEGKAYETWIYTEDGTLNEILVPEGTEIIPYIGQPVMNITDMTLEITEEKLLLIKIIDDKGEEYSSSVYLPTYGGEA